MNLEGRESGRRIFVGGSSPNLHRLDASLLDGQTVIGLNRWYRYRPCDYWLSAMVTTNAWEQYGTDILGIDAIRFMHLDSKTDAVPDEAAHFWFHSSRDSRVISDKWTGGLYSCRTSAVNAVHLAIILGASEVVLWGVDISGSKRFDGSVSVGGGWKRRFESVNNALMRLSAHIPIYKTNRKSPLTLPMFDFKKVR